MIRGYFVTTGGTRRPFIDAFLEFPRYNLTFQTNLLVDTGADRTVISPRDARRFARALKISLSNLPKGDPSTGVGGRMETRTIEALLHIDTFTLDTFYLTILEPPPGPLPSLLGRDILFHFGLFLEERTNRVLLLDPDESDVLHLP